MMMDRIRRAGKSWLGKIIVGVMFSVLIVSFAIWGIGDIFRGYGRNTVATVGKQEIGVDVVRSAYQNELQRLTQQARRAITPDMARALGLEQQVMQRLVTESVLDQGATLQGLAVSDEAVATIIRNDQAFQGANGQFDRNRFNDILRNNNLNEQMYIREQRSLMRRVQLTELVAGGLQPPGVVQEALHRYENEKRSIAGFTLTPPAIGTIATPGEAELKAYYEQRKATYRTPEYRSANVIALTASRIADPASITDADAMARYEQIKTQRFGSPERRRVQQIVFARDEDAAKAAQALASGQTFEQIAEAQKVSATDLTLGLVEKREIFDRAIADAAFSLAANTPSAPVKGTFGSVILRVTEIVPAQTRPFTEVAAELKQEMATQRAQARVGEIHDKIEDMRASARPLTDIAQSLKLELVPLTGIDRTRNLKAGGPAPNIPAFPELVDALFRSDVGVDNEALRTRDSGYVWFDVTGIEASRERSFDEVKGELTAAWLTDETSSRLAARGRELAARIDKGEAIAEVAKSVGADLTTRTDIARGTSAQTLAASAVNAVFSVPVGKAGSADLGAAGRLVFQVTDATVAPFLRTTQEAERLATSLQREFGEDLMLQYVTRLQGQLGVSINATALRSATTGGES
jgi:peptidyl-prolyl cis-trans isomerase D